MSHVSEQLPAQTAPATAINASQWRQFAKDVMRVYASVEPVQQPLRSATHHLYNKLVEDPVFCKQFHDWIELNNSQAHDWSTTLYEDDLLRAGLLGVNCDKEVPFHDHPGSVGITMVLSGIARIHYADLENKANPAPIMPLNMVCTRERFPGEVCWFFENNRNIHSIEAVTSKVLLLVIHLPPVQLEKQALYFPVTDSKQMKGKHIMVRRIELNTLKTKTNFKAT